MDIEDIESAYEMACIKMATVNEKLPKMITDKIWEKKIKGFTVTNK